MEKKRKSGTSVRILQVTSTPTMGGDTETGQTSLLIKRKFILWSNNCIEAGFNLNRTWDESEAKACQRAAMFPTRQALPPHHGLAVHELSVENMASCGPLGRSDDDSATGAFR